MSDRWLVHVGAGRSSIGVLGRARELGYRTLVFDRDPDAPGVSRASSFARRSRDDQAGMIADAVRLAARATVAGVLTTSSAPDAQRAAARLRAVLGCRGPGLHQVETLLDRSRWKTRLIRQGVPTPRSRIVDSLRPVREWLAEGPTLLLKPLSESRGSLGVAHIDHDQSKLESLFEVARTGSDAGRVLIEELAPGPEYSIDVAVQNGVVRPLQLGRKYAMRRCNGSLPVGYAWGRPAGGANASSHPGWSQLVDLAERTVAALSLDDTLLTLDVIAGDGPTGHADSPAHVIDVGLLLDAKVDQGLAFAGVDVDGIQCELATGDLASRPILDAAQVASGFATRFWYPMTAGWISWSSGTPEAKGETDCRSEIARERASGDAVERPTSVMDLVGCVHVEARNLEEAWRLASSVEPDRHFRIQSHGSTAAGLIEPPASPGRG